jgi:hypothetical protein
MIFNEVEFSLKTRNGNEFIKKSFYDVDSNCEIAKLHPGQEVEIEWEGVVKDCIVVSSVWNDYNIRGFLMQYELTLK